MIKTELASVFEGPQAFSDRTGIPYPAILNMAKMNELPCIRSGRRVYINVEQALAILDERSMERVVRHPIGATVITPDRISRFKGRPPDAIRKLKEAQNG